MQSYLNFTLKNKTNVPTCGHTNEINKLIPFTITNPPGQPELSYRVGTYEYFMQDMIYQTSLSQNVSLRKLATKFTDSRSANNDLAIGILSGSAIIFDILAFYQERIANEGFIRTATERRSMLEISRLIGYDLHPGVSASTFLAFTLEEAEGGVEDRSIIDVGTKVQSLPSNSEMPQIFETVEKIDARPEWNKLKADTTKKQFVDEFSTDIYLKGISTMLKEGDKILLVKKTFSQKTSELVSTDTFLKTVLNVEPQIENQITKVSILEDEAKRKVEPDYENMDKFSTVDPKTFELSKDIDLAKFDEKQFAAFLSKRWNMSEIASMAVKSGLNIKEFAKVLNDWSEKYRDVLFKSTVVTQVYTFHVKAGIFGNNAPHFSMLPQNIQIDVFRGINWDWDPNSPDDIYVVSNMPSLVKIAPFPINVKTYAYIGMSSSHTRAYEFEANFYDHNKNLIFLDRVYSSILPTSEANAKWIALVKPKTSPHEKNEFIAEIKDVREETVINFATSAKATGILFDEMDVHNLFDFNFRQTTVYAQSEELELSEIPDDTPIDGDSVTLDKMIANLSVGQPLAISGEILNEKSISLSLIRSEIVMISGLDVTELGYTRITFTPKLKNNYKRDTMFINANVARANHGQTKEVVLGGGDPSRGLQHFVLNEKPLTFVTSPTKSGVKSTLEIFVNDVKWMESPSLYDIKPNEHAYTIYMDNESKVHILFGGGGGGGSAGVGMGVGKRGENDVNSKRGMRPNAGLDNIKAKYRIGVGMDGMLNADQLTLLLDRPHGVRSVTNPVAPTGAADPETTESARQNAPNALLTFDRLISSADYENFANSYAGIGKATANLIWDGEKKIVYLSVVSERGEQIESMSPLYSSLVTAINNYKDPVTIYKLGTPQMKIFNVDASLLVSQGFEFEKVKSKAEEALKNQFSFKMREFGQSVTISEIMAVIQGVDGVAAVDVYFLYLSEQTPQYNRIIFSQSSRWDENDKRIIPSELLVINSVGGGNGIIINPMKKLSA